MRPPRIKRDTVHTGGAERQTDADSGPTLLHLIPGERRGDQRLGRGLIRRRLTAIDAIRSAAAAGR